jgi:hypothetical protein
VSRLRLRAKSVSTGESNSILRLIMAVLISSAMIAGLTPTFALATSANRIDVRIADNGPWIAQLVNFDQSTVQSVTYYIRDAKGQWTHLDPVVSAPFEAPIEWWQGDTNGYEAVTAHVRLKNGKSANDPGGWHWVNGHHTDPKGVIEAWVNQDGTPGASYTPQYHMTDIKAVQFWLRDASDHWHNAGQTVRAEEDSGWLLLSLAGTAKDWQGSENAISVHVVWPNDRQLIDPASWATTFTQPSAVGTATATAQAGAAPSAATCGDPHAHVYHPDRLQLLAPCVTVTGIVDVIRNERDGDLHVLLRLDPGQEKYLNAKNALELGDLVLEPVCVHQVTQADAIEACAGYSNPLTIPAIGSHVSVTGPWVHDLDHGWLEIHPVSSFGPVSSAVPAQSVPPATSVPAPPPVVAPPVPPAPPAAPADPYAALRAQGISAICNDGTYSYSHTRSGTCSHHGGVRAWTGLI